MIAHEILPCMNGVHRIRQKRLDGIRVMGADRYRVYYDRIIEVGMDWVKTGACSEYARSGVFEK